MRAARPSRGKYRRIGGALHRPAGISPTPNFARFDELIEEERRSQTREAATALAPKNRRRGVLLGLCGALAALLAVTLLFLSRTALSGYLPVTPVTLHTIHPNGTVTLSIGDAWATDILGKNTITVPVAAFAPLKAGQCLTEGAQLAIQLTNLDLIRLGIHPFHLGGWTETEVLNAQRKAVVRALFAGNPEAAAKLWVHETANLSPLFYTVDR